MLLSPADVQKLKRRLRGYSREAVEGLVTSYEQVWRQRDELHARVAGLEEELAARVAGLEEELAARVAGLEEELAPLRESEQHLRNILFTAERAAAEVRAEAEKHAEELLEQVRKKGREQQSAVRSERLRLKAENRKLELLERELRDRLRSFLLTGLDLVGEGQSPPEAPVLEIPAESRKTRASTGPTPA